MNYIKTVIASLVILTSNISYAQSCQEGIYVQGSKSCTTSKDACPSKYLYKVSCASGQIQLDLLRPSSTAKKYGYQEGDIRYQGSSGKGTFIQYFPTKELW